MKAGRAATVAAALAADALLGEPPEVTHPVVLMGRAISAFEKRALALTDPCHQRLAGLALAFALPALSYALASTALRLAPAWLRWPLEVALLSTALSMRGLAEAADAVERELESGDLEAARARVGEIVGRDTENLSADEVARAAVETVAENASDGVVAPMLYGFLMGAPGALAYKAVNTLDSMLGHETPVHRDLGLAPACLDDLANLLPARLTALAASAASGSFTDVWRISWAHGPLTRSPNAGWPEAAFAGALDLTLGGANSYGGVVRQGPTLGIGRPPAAADVSRAVGLMHRACLFLAVLALLPGVARRAGG